MSKVKVSMSFLFAMLLIGLFSAVAFAATQLSAPASLDVKTTANDAVTVSWSAIPNATDYTISVKDGEGASILAPISTSNKTTYDVSGLEVDKRYTVSVIAVGDATYPNSIARETGFVTHNQDTKVVPGDNGLNNANQTGLGDLNKAVKNQHTHGDYKNNTNSCASCHQTHTASGDTLLFKSSVYDTCVACHDGTLGYYNVFQTDNSKDLGGGTFGGTHAGNMSVHLANSTVEISAAPGSNSALAGAAWSSEFNCASCHDPHGSYSDRLLINNPNGMATVDRTVDAAQGLFYGNKLNDVPVIDGSALADTAARNTLVNGWAAGSFTTTAQSAVKALKFQVTSTDIATGGAYVGLGLQVGDWIVQLYRWDNTITTPAWVPAPFLQAGGNSGDGIDFAAGLEATATNDINGTSFINPPSGGQNGAWKNKVSNSKASVQPGWIVNGAKGFVKVGPLYDKSDANYGKITGTIAGDTTKLYPIGKLVAGQGGAALPLTDAAAFTTAFNTASAATAASIQYVTNVESVQVTKLPEIGTVPPTFMPTGVEVMKTDLVNIVGKNAGNGYNYYCAACHVDYLSSLGAGAINTANSDTGVGTGTTKYKHHSMSSSYTCARCHFAHGTDVDWMRDASGRTVTDLVNAGLYADKASAEAYMVDINPSSALKRYTNMTVCYGCHTSSHSEVIVNDGTYATSADQVNSINVDGTTSFFNNNVAVPKIVGQH